MIAEVPAQEPALTPRWYPLDYHVTQSALYTSKLRFCVVPAGRRSGKTELAKRHLAEAAMTFTAFPDGRFIAAAPTRDQAREIYWDDFKAMIPLWMIDGGRKGISESKLTIKLINGAMILVVGMDKPERVEGRPIDGIILDEYGNMKPTVWSQNVRPALSTPGRLGWAWLIGVPEGRNHYYRVAEFSKDPKNEDWGFFHWPSADILDPEEIAAARNDMDELSFQQEYEASFITFSGRVYYPFGRETHCDRMLDYNPKRPLMFCFDFNVDPGICGVLQDQDYSGRLPNVAKEITVGVGEVYIPRNSSTEAVCKKLIEDWHEHTGDVLIYGDASGGARHTSQTEGSDWDIVKSYLKPVFGDRLKMRVPRANPRERARINAMNSNLRAADGTIRFLINDELCPEMCADLEGTIWLKGGAQIDKKSDSLRTHMSDGIGYHFSKAKPLTKHAMETTEVF